MNQRSDKFEFLILIIVQFNSRFIQKIQKIQVHLTALTIWEGSRSSSMLNLTPLWKTITYIRCRRVQRPREVGVLSACRAGGVGDLHSSRKDASTPFLKEKKL